MTAGPATGAHLLPGGSLERFDLALGTGGVLLGFDAAGEQVTAQLFRARPTQVALVAASYVAKLLALRALAVGATAQVATTRPQGWHPVASAVPSGGVLLTAPGAPQPAEATSGNPLLRCDDAGPSGAGVRADVHPWQCRVALQDFMPATAVSGLRAFDLVVLQRVGPDLVHPLQVAFDLRPEFSGVLPQLPDDIVALITPGRAVLIRLGPTQVELSLLGAPVRHDG